MNKKSVRSPTLFFRRHAYIAETLFGFTVVYAFNLFFYPEDIGFLYSSLHPSWIVVLLIASRYGFWGGAFSGVAALLFYFGCLFKGLPTRGEFEAAAEAGNLWMPAAFLAIGILIGEIRQNYKNSEEKQAEIIEVQKREIIKLEKAFESGEKARRLLEARIVGQTATVKTLYESARKLESVDTERAYQGCLEILAAHLGVEKSSLYIKDGDYFVLKAHWGWEKGEEAEGKIHHDRSLMAMAFDENRVITVKDILARPDSNDLFSQYGQILAMVPVRDPSERTVGVINIEKIDFLSLNPANLELISLVANWTGQQIEMGQGIRGLKARLIWDEEAQIYQHIHFGRMLEQEFVRSKTFGLSLTVAFVKIKGYGFLEAAGQALLRKTVVSLLKKHMTKTDLIFHGRYEGTYAVLCPSCTSEQVREIIRKVSEGMQSVSGSLEISCRVADAGIDEVGQLAEPVYEKD